MYAVPVAAVEVDGTLTTLTFWVKAASVALVTIKKVSSVELSIQFGVIVDVVIEENVKVVGVAGIDVELGVQEKVLKLPLVVPAKFAIDTKGAKELVTGAVANVKEGVAETVTYPAVVAVLLDDMKIDLDTFADEEFIMLP